MIRRALILLSCTLLCNAPALAAPEANKSPLTAVAEAKDVPALAGLLQKEILALPDLMLQVKDAESLTKMEASVKASVAVVDTIAARLKTLPVPSAAERAELSKKMEAQDAAQGKAKRASFKKHMASMSPELREGVGAQMGSFFKALEVHEETMEKYLQPDQAETPAPPAGDKKATEAK